MGYVEILKEAKFGEIEAKRYETVNYAHVKIPDLLIEGDPRAIYRTLLNAADRLRREYAQVGLDFGFDCRVASYEQV